MHFTSQAPPISRSKSYLHRATHETANRYLEKVRKAGSDDLVEGVVHEYGNAIWELVVVNIFPCDLLRKNFGATPYGRGVFYDYDGIEYMTDCKFRRMPSPPNFEAEMSGEGWCPVSRMDVFPEGFETFLLVSEKIRDAVMRHHADLFDAGFWQGTQEQIRRGAMQDFFSYPDSLRFCNGLGRGQTV